MRQVNHIWNRTVATVYHLEAGEKVARHRHDFEHTTAVIAGRTEVVVWDNAWDSNAPRVTAMTPADGDYILPANLDHEVRALVPSIVIHIGDIYPDRPLPPQLPPPVVNGGVMMDDGTVQHEDT